MNYRSTSVLWTNGKMNNGYTFESTTMLSMEAKHSQRMHIEHFIYMDISGKFMGGRENRVVNTLLDASGLGGHKTFKDQREAS